MSSLCRIAALCLLMTACADSGEGGNTPETPETSNTPGISRTDATHVTDVAIGTASIDALDLATHVEILASDEFEGRAPSSPGETKTTEYIRTQLQNLGIAPGNGDSFYQAVPLVAIAAAPTVELAVVGSDYARTFAYGEDMMVWTKRVTPEVQLVDSELGFVGYGIVAPEYQWDDYAGVDVTDKTVVILVNDLALPPRMRICSTVMP